MSWRDAFQTTDRAVVEEYGCQAGMTAEWPRRILVSLSGLLQPAV
jgi:hypothetical protein